jgi:hypothetical protein
MQRNVAMNITPVIPDGYNGPIKQLTCRICKHLFYLTKADYGRLTQVSYCHECSLILLEELEKNQVAPSSIPPKQTPLPACFPTTRTSIRLSPAIYARPATSNHRPRQDDGRTIA